MFVQNNSFDIKCFTEEFGNSLPTMVLYNNIGLANLVQL